MKNTTNHRIAFFENAIIPRISSVFLVSFSILNWCSFSVAQAQSNSESEENVYDLSLFEVSASEDTGYLATQTLAGTRVKSNLRDLGATISVVTKEFLEDTGVTNANELLVYTAGTETGGLGGNFSGNVSGINKQRTPQFATRVRGLAPPDLTRDYFLSRIPFDSYNTDRVEINRGANSILFGLGSPVGIINNGLSKAVFDNFGEVNVRFGEHGSFRSSIDMNRELIEDKLAIRLSVLHDDEQYRQRPAFQEQDRYYGAITWKPFEHTRLRVNAEHGKIDANRPNAVSPASENISSWILGGNQIHDNSMIFATNTNAFQSGITYLDKPLSQGGVHHPGLPSSPRSLDLGMGTVFNSSNALRPLNTQAPSFWQWQSAVVFSNFNVANADGSIDHLGGTDLPNSSYATGPHPLDPDPDSEFGQEQLRFFAPRGLDEMYRTGYQNQGFNDRRAFDWVNNLLHGDSPFQNTDFDTVNIAIDQTFFENQAGIELAFDSQKMEEEFFTPGGEIYIDTNVVLPVTAGGLNQPNPNYLRPFINTGGPSTTNFSDERDAFRATGFFEFDFREKMDSPWTNWLGRHVLTGIFSDQTIETESINRSGRWTDPLLLRQSGTPNALGIQAQANQFVYLGPPINPGADSMDDIQINRMDGVNLFNPGYGNPITHWDAGVQPGSSNQRANGFTPGGAEAILAIGGADGFGNIVSRNVPYEMLVNSATFQDENIESLAFNLQSYLFSDLIVGTAGWREDTVTVHNLDSGQLEKDSFNALVVNGRSASEDPMPVEVSDDNFSWGVVGYWPEKWLDLPLDSTLSVHYSESSNFQPAVGRIDEFGNNLANPSGETQEYGVTLSLFDDKFYVRANRYETNLLNANSSIINFSQPVHLFTRWFGEGGRFSEDEFAATGLPQYERASKINDAAAKLIIDNTPKEFLEFWNFKQLFNEAGKVIGESHNQPSGLSDTEDVAAKGTEIEVVYNPTSNWRLIFNVARQEAVRSNIKPVSAAWGEWVMEKILDAKIPGYDLTLGELPSSIELIEFFPERSGDARFGDAWVNGRNETTMDHQQNNYYGPLTTAQNQEGAISPELREWRVNLVTTYDFTEGLFTGVSVGGAYRYQSQASIGYRFVDLDGDGLLDAGDVNQPWWGPSEENYDVWVNYKMPFFKEYGAWSVGLTVRNLFSGSDDFIPVSAHTNGGIARVRMAPPRTMYLSSKFKF